MDRRYEHDQSFRGYMSATSLASEAEVWLSAAGRLRSNTTRATQDVLDGQSWTPYPPLCVSEHHSTGLELLRCNSLPRYLGNPFNVRGAVCHMCHNRSSVQYCCESKSAAAHLGTSQKSWPEIVFTTSCSNAQNPLLHMAVTKFTNQSRVLLKFL